jgi:4-amino-4-deoxy-L-arabinose transferase-like glycosyltransferase
MGNTSNKNLGEWTRSALKEPTFYLCLVLLVYAALLLPTVARQGISWDEQVDIAIARSYIARPGGWFVGSDLDPSQTRLPMFTVALVYALLRSSDLVTARLVSCLVGALTIVGVYVYCKREYDYRVGLLASFILATSPFFLSFARTAFTETDVYVACTFSWLLVCMSHLREKPTVGRAATAAVALGLSISAKFTAVAILPAVAIDVLACRKQDEGDAEARVPKVQIVGIAVLLALMAVCALGGWAVSFLIEYTGAIPVLHYLGTVLWGIPILGWVRRHRHLSPGSIALAVFVTVLALLVFIVVPPVHLTNRNILGSLAGRAGNEMRLDVGFTIEAIALHVGCIIFKSSPLVGLGLLVGLGVTAFQWQRRPAARFPLLVALFYAGSLAILPIAQTFYTIPLLPILAILGAKQLSALFSKRVALAVLVGVLAVVLLVVDLWQCYPDYNLNGYQWLGARYWFGRSTIGYRSIVQTTSDGVQQVVEWMNDNVRPSERVLAYLHPWHIVRATSPDPPFRIVDGRREAASTTADYVLFHINCNLNQSWAGDPLDGDVFKHLEDAAWLRENYTKMYSVQRAFGIEVASVWKRD